MIVLGIDTALETCAAAVTIDGTVAAAKSEPLPRGHQERLAGLVGEVLDAVAIAPDRIDRIAVAAGPGSFTGVRVGLAFAKGFALALGADVVAVSTLDALAWGRLGRVVAAIDARRDQVYLRAYLDGRGLGAPRALGLDEAMAELSARFPEAPDVVVGSAAAIVADRARWAQPVEVRALAGCDPASVALCGQSLLAGSARPIYLREPDARLPA